MKYQVFTFLAAALFFSTTIFGQANFGVRIQTGAQNQHTESMYLISPGQQIDYNLSLAAVGNTQSIGLFTQFNFGFLYFQPEVLYTTFSSNYKIESFQSEDPSQTQVVTEKTQRLDLPINAGVVYKNFRIGGGPVFQIGHDIDSGLADYNKITVESKKITAGFQGGIAYQWKFIQVDLKYQTDFSSATDHVKFNHAPIQTKSRNSSIQLGIALALSKK